MDCQLEMAPDIVPSTVGIWFCCQDSHDEDAVREFFGSCGTITNVRFMTDRETWAFTETDEPSLAVRGIVEFRSPFGRACLELWVVSCTQLVQQPGKKLKLDPVSAQSFELLCYA